MLDWFERYIEFIRDNSGENAAFATFLICGLSVIVGFLLLIAVILHYSPFLLLSLPAGWIGATLVLFLVSKNKV